MRHALRRAGEHFVLATLAATLAVLLWHSWAAWGDLRVDCGGWVDRAATVAEGALLYRDVYSPYGPLAPYVLAGLFRIFGIHLSTVYALGVAILLVQSWCLWQLARALFRPAAAAVGVFAFWVMIGLWPGIFNWVLPNTIESSFGAMFATIVVTLLASDLKRPSPGKLWAASLATAAAGLSKIEFGVASAAVLVVDAAIVGTAGTGRPRRLAMLLAPGAIVTVAVGALFASLVPWRELVFDNLYRVRTLEKSIPALIPPFDPARMLAGLGSAVGTYAVEMPARAVLLAAGLALLGRSAWRALTGVVLVVVAVALPFALGRQPPPDFILPLFGWTPLAWLLVGAAAVVSHRRAPGVPTGTLILMATLSVALTARWRFNLMWHSYYAPFAPVLVLLIVSAVTRLAAPIRGEIAAAVIVLSVTSSTAWFTWSAYTQRRFVLDYARGRIRTTPHQGAPIEAVIAYLKATTSPSEFVVVLPEERFINFLAERRFPTGDPGVGPWWLATDADERRFIRALEETGTRVAVVSRRSYPEFDTGDLGAYNPRLRAYLDDAFEPVWTRSPYTIRVRFNADSGGGRGPGPGRRNAATSR